MKKYAANNCYFLRKINESSILIPKDEQVLLNNVIVELNETACFLYSKLDVPHSAPELAELLTEEYDTTTEQAAADVDTFLEKLISVDALTVTE